jgi:hypothetical protein
MGDETLCIGLCGPLIRSVSQWPSFGRSMQRTLAYLAVESESNVASVTEVKSWLLARGVTRFGG